MNKQIPSYLKLVTDTSLHPPDAPDEDRAPLVEACHAFEQATGWRCEIGDYETRGAQSNLMWSAPADPGVGTAPGHIRLYSTDRAGTAPAAATRIEDASLLAAALAKLWGELLTTRQALRQREAELAAGVPLVLEKDDAAQLSERLEAVLRCGAEAVGCQAAALYLLDPATTELKLRTTHGLPRKRFAEPARPLRGALADLEALLGHAVVLADDQMHDYWKVPEDGFDACVCVPVSSQSMPLGTLWVFSRGARDFTDAETNVLEVVAGRLAADLERQVLADEAIGTREQTRQISQAQQSQQGQLPRIAPIVEGWEIAAKAHHAGQIGGTFYDWFTRDDGSLAVVAGDAPQRGIAGALTASALRAASRAYCGDHQPVELLEKANSILWTGSAGNDTAGMFQAVLEEGHASCSFVAAGPMRVLSIGSAGCEPFAVPTKPLGLDEELHLHESCAELSAGDLLLAYGTTFVGDADELSLVGLEERLSLSLEPCIDLPASRLVEIADQILAETPQAAAADRVLVLMKRRRR